MCRLAQSIACTVLSLGIVRHGLRIVVRTKRSPAVLVCTLSFGSWIVLSMGLLTLLKIRMITDTIIPTRWIIKREIATSGGTVPAEPDRLALSIWAVVVSLTVVLAGA